MRAVWVGRCVVLGLLLAGVAESLQTARMALPPELAARAERHEARGFGGHNRGDYRLAEYSGAFTRIESRWAVFDPLYARSLAKSSYALSGPGLEAAISAECEMKEGTATIGIVTFDPKRMIYQCAFTRDGLPMPARFVLGEVKPDSMRARLVARAERRGELEVEGLRVTLASVHRYAGSRFTSQTPVGYVLEMDGTAVGAVELTDVNPVIFIDPALGLEARNATLMASLAVAVLRDPENSALAD